MAKAPKIEINDNAWTALQEPNAEKHRIAIDVRAENGKVVEIRIRHNDGEETKAKAYLNGKDSLPMAIAEFEEHFDRYDFDIK